jgi:heme/copper-type cytochrome/quinol oxidase subunit 4
MNMNTFKKALRKIGKFAKFISGYILGYLIAIAISVLALKVATAAGLTLASFVSIAIYVYIVSLIIHVNMKMLKRFFPRLIKW